MGKGEKKEGRLASEDRSGRREERDREKGRDGRWVEEKRSECAPELLLVATAEDIYPKVGPGGARTDA